MLQDLNKLALEAKAKRELYGNAEIKLSYEFQEEFRKTFPASSLEFKKYTCIDHTTQGLSIIIPNQWFIIASFFTEYLKALFDYKQKLKALSFSDAEIASFRNNASMDDDTEARIRHLNSVEESDLIIKFLTNYKWWFGYKTIDRGDFFVSSILNLASVVHVTQAHIASLANMLAGHDKLISMLSSNAEIINPIDSIITRKSVRKEFAEWLTKNENNNYFENDLDKTIKALSLYEEKYNEEFNNELFNVDFEHLDDFIKDVKQNIWNAQSQFWAFSQSQSTHQPRGILGVENYLRFLHQMIHVTPLTTIKYTKGYNKIYFGAPGTGKSYCVARQLAEINESQIERVIFHPEYDYSSFVGGYKPITEKDDSGKEIIKYKFVPQVFTKIFEKAHRNPQVNYYLVIEEINRGNCAEIFGDIFQLLDRNPNYAISPSEDLLGYLSERDSSLHNKVLKNGKLVMPDNLIILATMNTSDQSLYPMDSAFKRRWDWEYVPIKKPATNEDHSCPSFGYIVNVSENFTVSWIDFILAVNQQILQNPSLGLDKCIGNFFVKPDDGVHISLNTLINKVMFYLWNDVFKDEENNIFADHTYSDYFPIETSGLSRIENLIVKLDIHQQRPLNHEIREIRESKEDDTVAKAPIF